MAYKVIVADDEPIMRKAMQSLINWETLDCELSYLASNGREVMQQLELIKPDILILDIQMPGISGIELAKYVWEQKLPIKVILLTAYSDFSYAQQAIKYGVIDYVVKMGAFEGLIFALEKAKDQLEEERNSQLEQNIMLLKENFFKATFDNSLYLETEVRESAEKLKLQFDTGTLLMLIHFRMEEEAEGESMQRIHKSLMNFLHMVFENQMIHAAAAGKNVIAIVLSEIPEDYRENINQKCSQIIDMMENFMKMYIYIGISDRGTDVMELRKLYERAEYAIGAGFFDEKSKISYYSGEEVGNKDLQDEIEKRQETLSYLLKKGKQEEVIAAFHDLVELQKIAGGTANSIINSGITIRNWCRKILIEYDKTLQDITPYQMSISNLIYKCRHVSEYLEIMDTIIAKTAEYVNFGSSKKKILIYECEKFIEDNFEQYITVTDVARSIATSPSYLSRIFKEATGETIIYAINKRKIEKAKKYLAETDLKIYEIAEALGFENVTYFSHFFKKYVGVSPKEYKS